MRECGIPEKQIYIDRQSGKDFERANYKKMYRKLKKGDTLIVKSIDRLGRNYSEILEQWRHITKEKQVSVVVLDMPLLNTEQGRDLTGLVIADIVLQLLSYVAQTEREFIRQRQAEGIAAAKERGIRFGRPVKDLSLDFDEIVEAWQRKIISTSEASSRSNMSQSTFLRKVREYECLCEQHPEDE